MFYKFIIISLIIYIFKSVLKIIKISIPILKNQTSGYPNFVINFENDFKKFIGKKYALTFSNGTSALKAALFSLGIKKGYKILVPEYTFHASIDPVFNLGYEVEFIKANPKNLSLDIDDLKSKISGKNRALIVTHPFGFPANMPIISDICKKNKILLIEDCSHSHGASIGNIKIGKFANISIFSLQGNKSVSAGEGGIALTNSQNYYKKMLIYGHFANRLNDIEYSNFSKFSLTGWGEKMRCNPLGIILAKEDLRFLKNINYIKIKIYNYLKSNLKENENIFLIENEYESKPGGFFSGIPLIINKKVNNHLNNILKKNDIKLFPDPWFKLNNNLYDKEYRNNLFYKSYKVIKNHKDIHDDIFIDYKIYLIPLPRFFNFKYKKLVKLLNSIN